MSGPVGTAVWRARSFAVTWLAVGQSPVGELDQLVLVLLILHLILHFRTVIARGSQRSGRHINSL
jgi:hypothetical protein